MFCFIPASLAQESANKWTFIGSDDKKQKSDDIFSDQQYFNLEEHNEMSLLKEHSDELGNTHKRYVQTYKGIRVEGGDYILHYSGETLTRMNGNIFSEIILDKSKLITENNAIQAVLDNFNENDTPIAEYEIKKPSGYLSLEEDESLRGSIVISNAINIEKSFSIYYRFNIILSDIHESYTCYIDAISGEIGRIQTNRRNCAIGAAEGATLYNGWQNFKTRWRGGYRRFYQLEDECRVIHTGDYNGGDGLLEYKDSGDHWAHPDDIKGVSVHWALQRTFDFYEYAYNLTGVDGFYKPILALANYKAGETSWGNDEIHISSGHETLDIVGHEWTHGVDDYSANLKYQNESGALDESFADIMGTMVEYYVEGKHAGTYLMGDDAGAIRSLQNPAAFGDPSIYEGPNWHNYNIDPNDFGGVHTNSSVQNHWFYLLAEGGSQIVNGITYTVDPIGIENAAYVAYRNRRDWLTPNSQYADAKNGSIYTAMDIWGICDWKVEQVINAWNAVGVSSVNGIYFNGTINCNSVSSTHGSGLAFNRNYLNNLTSSCTYGVNTTTNLSAGNKITFYPGSIIKGNLKAHINPCLSNNMRPTLPLYPTNYGGLGNQSVEIQETIEDDQATKFVVFNIYPNPNNGQFNIELNNDEATALVEVYDMMGKKIMTQNNTNSNTLINIREQPKGIYLVKITVGNEVFNEKVIYQ